MRTAARGVDRRRAWMLAVAVFLAVVVVGWWWSGTSDGWKTGSTAAHAYGPTLYGIWIVAGPLAGAIAALYSVLLAGAAGALGGNRRQWLVRLGVAIAVPAVLALALALR